MKKMRSAIVGLLVFAVIVSMSIVSQASTLTLLTNASAQQVNVGESVTITVDWTEGMQAADFVLTFDNSKLEYQSSSIPEGFVNVVGSQIRISWFSTTGSENMTKATFTFKAISAGTVTLGPTIDGGFSAGNLVQPDNYDVNSKATITIVGSTSDDGSGDGNTGNDGSESGDSENSGSGSDDSGNSGSGSSDSGNSGSGSSDSGNSGSGSSSSNSGGTVGSNAQSSTNPAQKPTVLPKAGKAHILWLLPILVIMIGFSYYKIQEYKDI